MGTIGAGNRRMNILFVNHNNVSSNSANHIINLARALSKLGVSVALAVPDSGTSYPSIPGAPELAILNYSSGIDLRFPDGRGPDLVHAWTPRQVVSEFTRGICAYHRSPYLVHLEDNEYSITAAHLGISIEKLKLHSVAEKLPPHLSHPVDMLSFLSGAKGVTALIDRLQELKPAAVRSIVFWPAAEDEIFYPQPADAELRRNLGISDTAKVLVYHGNVHPANVKEVWSLYLAIAALARSGLEIVLVRLGTDHAVIVPRDWPYMRGLVIDVPFQPRDQLPRYLALADLFVQPGRVDEFNNYRFPSKLPEFMAMGKPVVLPACNVGMHVEAEKEALLLRRGDAIEIANAIQLVLNDVELARTLSAGSRSFYERELSWDKSAKTVAEFYASILTAVAVDRVAINVDGKTL
jgi:glycosyltransferase involved in cell wall biosynthesis